MKNQYDRRRDEKPIWSKKGSLTAQKLSACFIAFLFIFFSIFAGHGNQPVVEKRYKNENRIMTLRKRLGKINEQISCIGTVWMGDGDFCLWQDIAMFYAFVDQFVNTAYQGHISGPAELLMCTWGSMTWLALISFLLRKTDATLPFLEWRSIRSIKQT